MMRTLVTFGAALALGAGACASSSPEGQSAAPGGGAAAASPAEDSPTAAEPAGLVDPRKGGFDIGFGEYAVTLEAAAIRPGPVTFEIRNGGTLVHGFEMEIEGGDDSSGPGSGEDGFKIERPSFEPGKTIRVPLDLAAGTYKIECWVANHDDLGMEALLDVTPDAPKVPQAAEATGANSVAIQGFAFDPAEVSVQSGAEVAWTNEDPTEHTVSAQDGTFDSGPLGQGQTFSIQVDQAGAVTYICNIHPTMEGTIRVG